MINGTFVPTTADGASAEASVDGLCVACAVTDLGNVVSPALLQPARVFLPLGVLASARIRVDLPEVTAGGAAAGFTVRDRTGLLDLAAFQRLTVRTRLAGDVQDELAGSALLNVSALGADRFGFTMRTTESFDAIEIEISGAALALTDLDVLYGSVRVPVPPTVIVHRADEGATVSTDVSPTCIGCSIDDPSAVIDGSYRTAAEMSVPLALAGSAEIEVGFGRTVPPRTRSGFIVQRRDGLLDATVLEGLTVSTLLDGGLIRTVSGSNLTTINYADGRSLVWMTTSETADAVTLNVGALVGLSIDLDVMAAISVLPRGATREGETADLGRLAASIDLEAFEPESVLTARSAAPAEASGLGTPVPNPTTGVSTLRLAGEIGEPVHVAVYDALGREVARLRNGPLSADESTLRLDTAGWAPGVYVVRALRPGGQEVQRLTVVR